MLMPARQKKTMLSFFRGFAGVLCFVSLTGGAISSARAGFEWTPPAQETSSAPTAAHHAPSAPPMMPEQLPVPVDVMPLIPMPGDDVMPAAPQMDMRAGTAPRVVPRPSAMDSSGGLVDGFGKDIPLSLAIQQIAPSPYKWSFAPGTDQNTELSWTGGKPWRETLGAALAPHGLTFSESGHTICVVPKTETMAAPIPRPMMDHSVLPVSPAVSVRPPPFARPDVLPEGLVSIPLSRPLPSQIAPPIGGVYPWHAEKDQSLYQLLTQWSNIMGAQLIWHAKRDYLLPQKLDMEGTYPVALRETLSLFDDHSPRPVGKLYPVGIDTPAVLVVQDD